MMALRLAISERLHRAASHACLFMDSKGHTHSPAYPQDINASDQFRPQWDTLHGTQVDGWAGLLPKSMTCLC